MSVQPAAKKKKSTPSPPPQKTKAKSKGTSTPNRTSSTNGSSSAGRTSNAGTSSSPSSTNNRSSEARTGNSGADRVTLTKKEDKVRDNFVNPLDHMDGSNKGNPATDSSSGESNKVNAVKASETKPEEARATEAKPTPSESGAANPAEPKKTDGAEPKQDASKPDGQKESDAATKAKLPEGVTQDQATKVAKQIQDFQNLATHLPGILKMGQEIKDGGIQSKHTDALKAAYEPMKGLLTPENIQAFKNMDVDKVDKLFSEQNMGIMKAMAPKLAEGLNSEKITELKNGLKQAQQFMDKNKLGQNMSMMAPFVKTSAGEGALNKVAGMVDDPNQLGGADRKLSMTDIGQVTNGLLNTGPVQGIVNGKINDGINHAVNYRQDGQARRPLGRAIVGGLTSRPKVQEKIYSKAWGEVRARAPGEVSKQAAPFLGQNGSPQDRNIPRRFNDQDVRELIDVGKQVQGMRGQGASTGSPQIDNANSAMAGMTGILHKSVIGDDGMVSGDELRNVSGFGSQLYNYMGLLYQGVGGQYR